MRLALATVVMLASAACAKEQSVQVVLWDALPPYEIYRIPNDITVEQARMIATKCDRDVPIKFGLNHHDLKDGYSLHQIGFPRDAPQSFRQCLLSKARFDRVHYVGEPN